MVMASSIMQTFIYFFLMFIGNMAPDTPNIPKLPENEKPSIVFIEEYTNYAWGYQCGGIFCDANGDVYKYDLSDKKGISAEEKRAFLLDIIENEEPLKKAALDKNELLSAQSEALKIDKNAGFTEKHAAYDAGQRTLYVCTKDFELIKLRSTGDYDRLPNDKTAKRLCSLWKKIS